MSKMPAQPATDNPKAFVSYSWDDEGHKAWVKKLATRLREDGVNIILDQWHVVPGTQLPEFMERAVRESDFVLIVCTPRYKGKSDGRIGGVGYEGHIMTAEVFAKYNHEKFIPLLRNGRWGDAAPWWLSGKYYIDLRGEPYREDEYRRLLNTLHRRNEVPPLGPIPDPDKPLKDKRPKTVTGKGILLKSSSWRISWWLVTAFAVLVGLIGWAAWAIRSISEQPAKNQVFERAMPTSGEIPNNLEKRSNVRNQEATGNR